MSEIYTPPVDFPGSPEDAYSDDQLLEIISKGPGEAPPATEDQILGPDGKPIATQEGDEDAGDKPGAESNGDQPTFEIDGEKVTLDQLREWKKSGMFQADYTRKTQELKARSEHVERLDLMDKAWASNRPDLQSLILDNLLNEATPEARATFLAKLGSGNTGNPTAPASSPGLRGQYDPNARTEQGHYIPEWEQRGYYDENEFKEAKATQTEIAQLRSQNSQLMDALRRIEGHLGDLSTREQRSLAAKQQAAEIGKELGLADGALTPEMVLEAMTATGMTDPKKAVWAEFGPQIAKGMTKAPAPAKDKPSSPSGSQAKTFDPDTVSADEMARLLHAGWKAVTPKPAK